MLPKDLSRALPFLKELFNLRVIAPCPEDYACRGGRWSYAAAMSKSCRIFGYIQVMNAVSNILHVLATFGGQFVAIGCADSIWSRRV